MVSRVKIMSSVVMASLSVQVSSGFKLTVKVLPSVEVVIFSAKTPSGAKVSVTRSLSASLVPT